MKKIIIGLFIFLSLGIVNTYAIELKPAEPIDCPAPAKIVNGKCSANGENGNTGPTQQEDVKEILITNSEEKKEGVKNFKPLSFTEKLTVSGSNFRYITKNSKGEIIYFANNQICNTYNQSCSNIDFAYDPNIDYIFKKGQYIIIASNRDYRATYDEVEIFIYNLENGKFLKLNTKFLLSTSEPYHTDGNNIFNILKFDSAYADSRLGFIFDNNKLFIFKLHRGFTGTNYSEKENVSYTEIDFNNIEDKFFTGKNELYQICKGDLIDSYKENRELFSFNESQYGTWYLFHSFYDLYKIHNKEEFKNMSLDCGYYSMDYLTSGINSGNFELVSSFEDSKFLKFGFFENDSSLNMEYGFIESKRPAKSGTVVHLANSSMLYTGKNGKIYTSYYYKEKGETRYSLNEERFLGFFETIFVDFYLIDVNYNKLNKQYYISYYKQGIFYTLKVGKLYDLNNDDTYEILENKYYLGTYNGVDVFYDGSYVEDGLANLHKDYYFPTLFLGKSGEDIKFYYLATTGSGYYLYYKLLESENNIFKSKGGIIFNSSNFKIENGSIESNNENVDHNGGKTDESGHLTDTEAGKLNTDTNQGEEYYRKYFLDVPLLGDLFGTFSFSFPDDWNQKLKIPFLIPKIEDGTAKIGYKVYNLNLEPVNDKLKIDSLGQDSGIGKSFLSFFAAAFYLMVKFGLLFFVFFFIRIIYGFLKSIFGLFFISISNTNIKGNIFTFGIFIGFSILFLGFIASFIALSHIFNEFMTFVKNIIDILFGFIVSNFLDFNLFKKFIAFVDTAFIGLLFGYIGLVIATSFGKSS